MSGSTDVFECVFICVCMRALFFDYVLSVANIVSIYLPHSLSHTLFHSLLQMYRPSLLIPESVVSIEREIYFNKLFPLYKNCSQYILKCCRCLTAFLTQNHCSQYVKSVPSVAYNWQISCFSCFPTVRMKNCPQYM